MVRIAVILPCYNEEPTVADTIRTFRENLPGAEIWVCDNRSTDQTAAVALANGAKVIHEPRPGKGSAVRRLFAEVDADVYVMADGDTTYDAKAARHLIDTLLSLHLDMVVGRRVAAHGVTYRPGHKLGNAVFSKLVSILFQFQIADVFSGYRVFSRRFVKTFPAVSEAFEIESELNIHAIDQRLPTAELDTIYSARPVGSQSKLTTFHDGFLILVAILRLLRDTRPLQFFGLISLVVFAFDLVLSFPVFANYFRLGTIPNLPTAILVTGIAVVAFVFFLSGVILDAVRVARHNQFRAAYLAQDTAYFQTETARAKMVSE
jgi:glycosyltransferase involved in cell wall biosynthesis